MSLRVFWDKERRQEFSGRIYISCTSETHCSSCDGGKRPLARGIAVHFVDADNRHIFTTGPDCFKKHTDLPLSQIPVIGYGFSDINTGRKNTKTGGHLSSKFKPSAEGINDRQQMAYANVMLRAQILPSMGFLLKQPGLEKFLSLSFPYDEKILSDIEKYVSYGERHKGRPSLDQLSRALYVANQIKALLEKPLWSGERSFIESLDKTLKTYIGLTDRQMESLEGKASKYGLLLERTGIRFPENQKKFLQSPKFDLKE